MGRFISRDPIGYAGGINLYGYCENDPVNAVDPSGNLPFLIIVGAIMVGGMALAYLAGEPQGRGYVQVSGDLFGVSAATTVDEHGQAYVAGGAGVGTGVAATVGDGFTPNEGWYISFSCFAILGGEIVIGPMGHPDCSISAGVGVGGGFSASVTYLKKIGSPMIKQDVPR